MMKLEALLGEERLQSESCQKQQKGPGEKMSRVIRYVQNIFVVDLKYCGNRILALS